MARLSRAARIAVLLAVCAELLAQAPAASPSPVDLSAPALQFHASLGYNDQPGPQLDDMLARSRPIGLSLVIHDEPADVSYFTPARAYTRLACSADAIVIGYVTRSLSHLTKSGSSIYSDYDFVIESVLKDNLRASIASRVDIVVTRRGGAVQLPNGNISLTVEVLPPFQPDTSYLVFLAHIPESGGYVAKDQLATLFLRGNQWYVARKAQCKISYPALSAGNFERTIDEWLRSCSQ
jgi:hypothetical protein